MRVNNVLLSIIIIFTCASCSVNTQDFVTVDGNSMALEEFVSTDCGFTIIYPKNWVVIESEIDVCFLLKDLNQNEINLIDVQILSDAVDGNSAFIEKIEEDINNTKPVFTDFRILKKEKLNYDNMEGKLVTCSYKSEQGLMQSYLIYIHRKNKVYSIGMTSKIRDFEKYSELYDRILLSFKAMD